MIVGSEELLTRSKNNVFSLGNFLIILSQPMDAGTSHWNLCVLSFCLDGQPDLLDQFATLQGEKQISQRWEKEQHLQVGALGWEMLYIVPMRRFLKKYKCQIESWPCLSWTLSFHAHGPTGKMFFESFYTPEKQHYIEQNPIKSRCSTGHTSSFIVHFPLSS